MTQQSGPTLDAKSDIFPPRVLPDLVLITMFSCSPVTDYAENNKHTNERVRTASSLYENLCLFGGRWLHSCVMETLEYTRKRQTYEPVKTASFHYENLFFGQIAPLVCHGSARVYAGTPNTRTSENRFLSLRKLFFGRCLCSPSKRQGTHAEKNTSNTPTSENRLFSLPNFYLGQKIPLVVETSACTRKHQTQKERVRTAPFLHKDSFSDRTLRSSWKQWSTKTTPKHANE